MQKEDKNSMNNKNLISSKKLAIYVHIPFCAKKCAYCDFLSAPATSQMQTRYMWALCMEIAGFVEKNREALSEYKISSVFFGGGTPSIVEAHTLVRVLTLLRESLPFDKDAEISIECNPGTITKDKLSKYKRAGINRISIGLQSTDNRELALLGRIHTWEDFLFSYQLLLEAGFDNINIDLISALPGQTLFSYEETLKKVIALSPAHISAYSLIIEEETPFYQIYGDKKEGKELLECVPLPDEETERQMYVRTGEILRAAGYSRYEISNYALPGKECRHNQSYWNRTEYIGFGLGAASFFGGCRFSNERDLTTYIRLAEGKNSVCAQKVRLSLKDGMEEFMFLGLRMMCGVSEDEFFKQFGRGMWEIYGKILQKHISLGLLEKKGNHIALTERGIDVSNMVFCDFLLEE